MNEQNYTTGNPEQPSNPPVYEQTPPNFYYPPQNEPYPPYQQGPYYNAAGYKPVKQKQKMQLDQRDWIFAGLSFLLSLLGVICGLWGHFYLGFTVSFVLLFFVLSAYLGKGAKFPGITASLCGICSLALSAVFFCTTEKSVRFFSVILLPCLSSVWFAGLTGRRIAKKDLGLIAFLFSLFAGSIGTVPGSIAALFSAKNRKSKFISKIIIGVLCAVPVLFAVIPLLRSSDEAFSNLLGRMFTNMGELAAQIILSLLIAPLLTGYAFYLRKKPPEAERIHDFKGVDTTILTTALSVLSVCYLVYLFSQLAYFFSGFLGILPEGYGFSHAEYARRGFFELCAIAGINLAVLFAVLLLSRKTNDKPPMVLRLLATFISLFNLLLIGTALSKLILYIRAYGMTVLRITTSAFAVFMAFVFVAMLLRYYLPKIRVLSAALPAAACVLVILGVGNVNRLVANYNYQLYRSNSQYQIDVRYFGELGAEGAAILTRLAEDENENVAKEAQITLYYALQDQYRTELHEQTFNDYFTMEARRYLKFSEFCIPRWKMYKETDAFLAAHPDFEKEAAELDFGEWQAEE